jgi:uncharacterized caspase-like protein
VKDASAIAKKLKRYGFALTHISDGTFADMRTALSTFQGAIEPGGVALVFFAGHGVQIDGENFLFAGDTDASGENQAKFSSLSQSGYRCARPIEGGHEDHHSGRVSRKPV